MEEMTLYSFQKKNNATEILIFNFELQALRDNHGAIQLPNLGHFATAVQEININSFQNFQD